MPLTPLEMQRLTAETQRAQEAFELLSRTVDNIDIAKQFENTKTVLTENVDTVRRLQEALARATQPGDIDKLNRHLDDLKTGLTTLGDESNLVSAKYKQLLNQMSATGDVTSLTADQLKNLNKELETFGNQVAEGAARGETLKKQLFGLSGTANKLSSVIPKSAAGFKGMGKSLFSASTVGAGFAKVAGTIINQTIGLAKAQDAAISSFRKATGATEEYNRGIVAVERRNFAAGVSAADAGKAYEALFQGFSAFTQLNENQQAAVADTAALLGELGVSAQTTAKLFDTGMRSLGMSVGASNAMVLDLVGSAQSLGVSMDKMTADFVGASAELSKYGSGATEVFKGLAVQAKNTGLEVSQLLSVTKQFDQFDSAGKAVGRLNAILGGPYLNSIDMLNATEEERIDLLKRSVDMAGVQFDALGRYEKQAIASSLGMSVDEANRLFSMSQEQYKLDAMKQKELKELATETQEIMEKLKVAMMGLAINMRPLIENVIVPLVKGFGKVAQWIGKGTNALGQFVKVGMLAAGIAAIVGAPFTGGASLITYAAIAGTAGLGAVAASSDTTKSAQVTPRFHRGGPITTEEAVLHRDELLLTGGQGSEVISAKDFKELILALKSHAGSNSSAPSQLAVYIGQDKLGDFIVKALRSPEVAKVLSPYALRTV